MRHNQHHVPSHETRELLHIKFKFLQLGCCQKQLLSVPITLLSKNEKK